MPPAQSSRIADMLVLDAGPPVDPAGDDDAAGAGLDPRITSCIGEALRAHYLRLLSEPLPPRFEELIGQLGSRKVR